jgi:exodeoxyribonuclease-3
MKLISWNVNGIRACMEKGFMDFFRQMDADVFCLQETKVQQGQISLNAEGYYQYWNYAVKKGYSGTALFSKKKPLSVVDGIGMNVHDNEGRVITAEYENCYVITVYTPNAQHELARLDYRMQWEDDFRAYVQRLDQAKPIIFCGDLNVAHQEIDLKNPSSNRGNAGFSDQEREKMTVMLQSGFTDSFRYLYPDKKDAYTWWSYMFKARERNVGWRIDYFLVSDRIREKIRDAVIYADVMGSDHCPVGLEIDV